MTPGEFNTLPEWARAYIHDLKTRYDPAGDLRALWLALDENRQLRAKVAELEAMLKHANEWAEATRTVDDVR